MGLEAHPPLPPREREAVERALVAGGLRLDGTPPAYRAAWRRAGIAEAAESAALDGSLGALAAEDARSDARVVEP